MKMRRFGRSDIQVSELCLGTSNFALHANQENSFSILDAFREAGGTTLQTSGLCPGARLGDGMPGLPEEFLGRWLASRAIARDDVVLATRFALARPVVGGKETYTDLVQSCVRDSVRRMGADHLDFLVVEWSDAVLPLGDSLGAFEAVVRSGLARYVVAAHFPPDRLTEALEQRASAAIEGIQLDYSLAYRELFESDAAPICRDEELGVIARSPLAGGHLIARPSPHRTSFHCRSLDDVKTASTADTLWPTLVSIARSRRATPAQVAVAWTLGRSGVTSVLVSVRSLQQFHDLLAATRLGLLEDDISRLGAHHTQT